MEKVRLGDICDVRDGTHDSPKYHDSGYPLVTSKNLSKGFVDFTDCNLISKEDYDKINIRSKVDVGDILMPMIGTVGNPVIVQIEPEFAIKNVALIKFYKDSRVLNKYIKVLLESNYFDRTVLSKIRGGTQKFISLNDIRRLEIILPPISEQLEIVDRIEKVNVLIDTRKEQLEKLNELVKARFVELFGSDEFNKKPLKLNVEEMFIGPFGSSLKNECFVSKEEGFCMVYEQKHAIKKTMNVETRFVDESKYNELKRFTVVGGDIIVSCRGTIGEVYDIPNDAPMGIMHPSIMKIRLKQDVYNKKFFIFALEEYMRKSNDKANGSGIKMAVTATTLGNDEFIVPPIDLQNQFAAFVEQTDKSKLEVQKSLEKLELLKKALMQKYFG